VRGKPIAVAAALESPFTGSPPRCVPASLSRGAQRNEGLLGPRRDWVFLRRAAQEAAIVNNTCEAG